jgi:hypothetical protein
VHPCLSPDSQDLAAKTLNKNEIDSLNRYFLATPLYKADFRLYFFKRALIMTAT